MSETKFTPGPWEASWSHPETDGICYIVPAGNDHRFHEIATLYQAGEDEKNEFDAHLIAAAPELYEALEDAIQELSEYAQAESGETYNNPRFNAILSKARGEQPTSRRDAELAEG